jgi:parallel beta-helix repeat protein
MLMKKLHYEFARITLTLLSLLFLLPAQAATYYFSSSQGEDSRSMQQAQNPSTPWRSIAKLNAIFSSLRAGDVILFKRGDTFEGTIIATRSGSSGNPITFSAYGSGNRPVISGFGSVGNWTNLGKGVWEASLSSETATLNMVTINEVAYAMGRYPNSNAANKGYLTIDNASGTSSIYDNQLGSYPNWNGAEVVIRKDRWIIDRNKVTSHSGGSISYNTASSYNGKKGYGYFIQNHPATLDSFGEWYYNKSTKKLRVYFGSNSPSSYRVKASRRETGVTFNRNGYLKFDNLTFEGYNFRTFDVERTTDVSVINCQISFSGTDAVYGFYTRNFKLENSEINNTFNNAVSMAWECPGVSIRNNQVRNVGYLAGMGQSGNLTYQAILVIGHNVMIENNSIINTGYVPLSFRGNNSVVRKNYVENFCYIKDDGGAIHTWNDFDNATTLSGQKVTDNIIINGVGAPEGTANQSLYQVKGIYMDDNTANVEIARNTVSKCSYGLYVHNARNLNVYNNTFFDNRVYQVLMEHDKVAADKPIRNVTFKYNILASKDKDQELMALFTKDNDISQFGTFSNNYYTRTISTSAIAVNTIVGRYASWQKDESYNLNAWKKVHGFESGSVENKPMPHYRINQLIGGNKFPNRSFDSNVSGIVSYHSGGSLRINWDNTNKMNGGSLRASFAYKSGKSGAHFRGNIGGIDKNKKYIVKFSILGANADRTLKIGLLNNNVANQYLFSRTFKSTTSRTDYEFLFEPSGSTSSAALRFDFSENDGTIWVDNVEFHEADVTIDAGHVRLEHNPSNNTKTVSLGNTYLTAKLQTKTGSLSIISYASEVLMKQSGSIISEPEPAPAPEPAPTTSSCDGTGGITREYWTNVSGSSVSSIPVSRTPSSVTKLTSFESPSNVGDNYGQRIRGYICVPVTGNYTFYISGDDNSELWLSSDEKTSNKRKIASIDGWTMPRSWTKYDSQKSATYYLKVGEKYYIEALHKEASYGDNLAVAWVVPGTSAISVIPGKHLIPYSSSNARLASDEEVLNEVSSATAYPNPFEDRLYIQTDIRGDVQISVIDALGRVCYQEAKSIQESTVEIDLAQSNLTEGVYFVKLQMGDKPAKVVRVVKR